MEFANDDVFIDTVRLEVARAVAREEVPDDIIIDIGRRLGQLRVHEYIKWIDICMYGICVDLFFPWEIWQHGMFDDIFNDEAPVTRLGVEVIGLKEPELAKVRVEYRFDELSARVQPRRQRLFVPQDPIPC